MNKQTSQARKQRRLYEAFLKKFHPAQYREYKAGVIERGKKIHASNVEEIRKAEEARYEAIQTRLIQDMRNEGKSNEEIDEYINDWVQTIKVWGSDERPKRWREIRREKLQKQVSND
jgi:hypothetical protein